MSLLPFSFCQSEHARQCMPRGETLSVDALKKRVQALASMVERKIADVLPETFALIMDGWSAGDTHYVAVFAAFPNAANSAGYQKALLTFSPMLAGDEDTSDAKEHFDFMTFVLESYGKSWENVAAIVGDNCATNKALARRAKCHYIGCARHRFDLAVKDLLIGYKDLVTKVDKLMTKLKNIILAAKLQKLTPLKPMCSNVTWWSSTYEMLSRYEELKAFLPRLRLPEIDEMMPTAREDREIRSLLDGLRELNEISECLHDESTTMAEVRSFFDAVIDEYPELKERLQPSADIVADKAFESAIVKVQNGRVATLTAEEASSVARLEAAGNARDVDDDQEMSLVERARKRRRREMDGQAVTRFIDLRFLVPTSNICERLFSKAGYALNDCRQGILPPDFELQLFLNANHELWSLKDIDEMLKLKE